MAKFYIYFGLIIGLFCGLYLFFNPDLSLAQETPSVILNEIMYDAAGTDEGHEWVEIYNFADKDVEIITGSAAGSWRFFDGSNHTLALFSGSNTIGSNGYAILADDPTTFLNDYPTFSGTIFKVSMSLNNTGDNLKLSADKGETWFSEVNYTNQCGGDGDGHSLEKSQDNNWYISQKEGGTPGEENTQITSLPENVNQFSEILNLACGAIYFQAKVNFVVDGDTLKVENLANFPTTIRLLGIDSPEFSFPFYRQAKDFVFQKVFGKDISLLISPRKSEQIDSYNRTLAVLIYQDEILNLSLLQEGLAQRFTAQNLLLKSDQWDEVEKETKEAKKGIWSSLIVGKVVISELLPDPVGSDSAFEWIELQNLTLDPINLSGWILDKKTQFKIPAGTIIPPNGFLVFYRPQTKIVLANDGDSLDLYFPDGTLADSISYSKAPEGQSYARLSDGSWRWTTTPSPGAENILTLETEQNLTTRSTAKVETEDKIQNTLPKSNISQEKTTIQTVEIIKTKKYKVLVAGTSSISSGKSSMIENPKMPWYIQVKITLTLFLILLIYISSRVLCKSFVKVHFRPNLWQKN